MSPDFRFLDQVVSYWATTTTTACALRWPGGSHNYQALETRIATLAHTQQDNNVGPGGRVGIYMEKSQGIVLVVYAVLRSGAVYVPLDPAAPRTRLEMIITSCGIEVAISDPAKRDLLTALLRSGRLDLLAVMSLVGFVETKFKIAVPFDEVLIKIFEPIDAMSSFVTSKRDAA